jgi:hypothetical protein
MSDGPHRSLEMSKAWKRLARWADKSAYDLNDVAGQVPVALKADWNEQGCGEVMSRMSKILGDGRQGKLFAGEKLAELKTLQRDVGAGFPLRRLLVDHAIHAVNKNPDGTQHHIDGTAAALKDHLSRRNYQFEEHYRRESTDKRAMNIGVRMEQAMLKCSFDTIAKQFLGESKPAPRPSKQGGLDDGVTLP